MYHLFRSCSTFNCPENFPKLQTIRWVFVMLPSLSIGLTSKYWKLGCQPSKNSTPHLFKVCSIQKKISTSSSAWYFFWGRDTLKSTLIKTRLSLTSRMWKRSFENGVTTFWVQGQAKSMIMTCHRQVCGKKGKFKLIDQIRFPTSCLSVSNDFQYPTTSGLLFLHAGIGCCVPSIKVGDGLFAKVHGRHASWQRFLPAVLQSASKTVQEFTTPKNGSMDLFLKRSSSEPTRILQGKSSVKTGFGSLRRPGLHCFFLKSGYCG